MDKNIDAASGSESPDGPRRASIRVDPNLASEEDAQVLARMGCVKLTFRLPDADNKFSGTSKSSGGISV